jgi:hypothetical protein
MASGNLYKLLINNGKQDMLLEQGELLFERMSKLHKNMSWKSVIEYIGQTHFFPINSYILPSVPIAYEYKKLTQYSGPLKFGSNISVLLNNDGTWLFDMVVHLKLKGLSAKDPLDKVRYTEFLGHRLFDTIVFKCNGDVLQTLTPDIYNLYYQRQIPLSKKNLWKKMIGQEIPLVGQIFSEPRYSNTRQYFYMGDGPQTLKTSHDEVEIWLPLIFWFNTDVTKMLPIAMIPAAELKIEFTVASLDKIAGGVPYNGDGKFTTPTINEFEMFVNHIETIESIRNVMMSKKILLHPIRSYDYASTIVNESSGKIISNKSLTNIKGTIEAMYIGFKPAANANSLISWCQQCEFKQQLYKMSVIIDNPTPNVQSISQGIYYKDFPSVDNLSFYIDNVAIYNKMSETFYSKYMMGKIQNDSEESADDFFGWNFIDFSLAARNKTSFDNHFGYINLSQNRNFFLDYTSSTIGPQNQNICTIVTRVIKWVIYKNNHIKLSFF